MRENRLNILFTKNLLIMVLLRPDLPSIDAVKDFVYPATPDYDRAEQLFIQLLTTDNLDRIIAKQGKEDVKLAVQEFETALETALAIAYINRTTPEIENRFLQRILYRINRLNFIWYKDLNEYTNERSLYVRWVRDRIEEPWQAWESAQLDLNTNLSTNDIKAALIARGDVDLVPPISANKRYLSHEMTLDSYRHLIAIASLDGLVESSRLCHLLGGASNEIQATFFEIVGPSVYQDYIAAAARLGLSETAKGYWELHVKEDERHGQWMLHNVCLPLVDMYPQQAWELVLGYDQDKYMSGRAGDAIVKIIQNLTSN